MTSPEGSTGVLPKTQKSKRKISLPWFRQGSVAKAHPGLTRQHTIDTPSSYQARLRRQPSQVALAGVLEMTWVLSDFTATSASELSVSKGQQVEVVEVCSSRPEFCLVRMPTRGSDHGDTSVVPEGLVPLAILKQPPPTQRGSPSRKTNLPEHEVETVSIDTSVSANTSSPVNKRRGFSGRKWLPPPLRKLSQGKVDKAQTASPPLKKTGSDKRIKVPSEMGNKPSVSEGEEEDDRPPPSLKGAKSLGAEIANGGSAAGEEADEELELPPPMKPIQEPILVTPPPPSLHGGGVSANSEENPCKREQHSEIQERNSLMRDAKSENALSDYGVDGVVGAAHLDLSHRFSNEASSAFSGDESDKPSSEEAVDVAKKTEILLKKRAYVLQELIDTEEAYVRDLSLIVDGYVAAMKDPECEISMPEDLRDGKDKLVFGNIEVIYDWHKDFFLKSLKQAVENPIELASLFKRYERKLQMYVIYCKNKHVSEYIVSEHLDTYFEEMRVKLGHKLQLCDLLIKPVQRIMKYQLMLKDILKYTERAGIVSEIEPMRAAYNIMVVVPKTANDMMDVGRLQGFEGKITAQGKLLYHGMLSVSDLPGTNPLVGKNKDLHVFFFEQSVIFSEVAGKKTQFTSPQYIYKAHIQVNKLSLKSREDSFILESTDPNRCLGFTCQAASDDVHKQWLTTIHDTLQKQRDFLIAIQSPIAYQKELTREASLSDLSMFDMVPLRQAVPQSPQLERSKSKRKNHYVHKANTIGIPSEKDLLDTKNNNPRSRRNFFEGFRNTLKHKHKSDPVGLQAIKEGDQADLNRRWSEENKTSHEQNILAAGTRARLNTKWQDLNQGETVLVTKYDPSQGYLVKRNSGLENIWIPAHVLSNFNRKHGSFKFLSKSKKVVDENCDSELAPEFKDKLKDVTVRSGAKAVLICRVKNYGKVTQQTWEKLEPDRCVLGSGNFLLDGPERLAMITIENAKVSDSGTYAFSISNEYGTAACSALLTVTDNFTSVPEPKVQVISSSSVLLEWDSADYSQFVVEYCRLGSGEWVSPNNHQPVATHQFIVENLIPGETYSFRIVCLKNNYVSLPSAAVSLPAAENLCWQQEQFKRRYIELDEIGRGRFSVVRLARDRGTGVEVALKQVSRRKQSYNVTQSESSLLAEMQHPNIIRSMVLFENAPVPGVDTIVLELVKGPLLFHHICEKEQYSEMDVRTYSCQLISALEWLHRKKIAHLDVKPENVMIDLSTAPAPLLKLVDFGDSVTTAKNVILPPACLEFASPELVLGKPVGTHTDCWAVGVFLYVLLSGVSPFLDDSVEETTANILKSDFCFPDEYFGDVSEEARELVASLLVLMPSGRRNASACLECAWMKKDGLSAVIPSSRLRSFMQRRHPMHATALPSPVS